MQRTITKKQYDSLSVMAHQASGTYCYHSDHLGSATWITTGAGQPVEYLHYLPYGELWRDQRTTSYSERFRFTGKERDTETGYDYFGARYYSSTLPTWLSVDPLSDKYPNISPFAYCANNPIRLIDINGLFFDDVNETIAQKIENYVCQRIKHTNNEKRIFEFKKTLRDVSSMRKDKEHEYCFIQNNSDIAQTYGINSDNSPVTMSIDDNPQKIGIFIDIQSLNYCSPDESIAHEVRHGGQIARGELIFGGGRQNYNSKHEIDAYRAQWSWTYGGLILPTVYKKEGQLIDSPNQINKSLILNIIDVTTQLPLYNFK